MKPIKTKDRCTKKRLEKCEEIARLYSKIAVAYADILEADDGIQTIACNVPMEGLSVGGYSSDFVCTRTDGSQMVRECVWRRKLLSPRTAKLLDASREYWLKRGVQDWGIVIEKEGESNEAI